MTVTETPRAQWFTLPPSATDWLRRGERAEFWLAPVLSESDERAAWAQLAAWDALVGRLLRAYLFDESHVHPRKIRKDAEAIAAVAEALAVRLGQVR